MTLYNILGLLSSFFFLLTLYGLFHQIQVVVLRRKSHVNDATASISLNQWTSSFVGFYSFFIYGICLEGHDYYLFLTRALAVILISVLLWFIHMDRKQLKTLSAAITCSVLVSLGFCLFISQYQINPSQKLVLQYIFIPVTLIIAQGYGHQLLVLRKEKQLGGVAPRTQILIVLKDIFTTAFAFSMKLSNGWPILLSSITSIIIKSLILLEIWKIKRSDQKVFV